MAADAALAARARAWLDEDPDPETRAELTALLAEAEAEDAAGAETAAHAELAARFAGELEFGTAGLRAELGAGPMRMNRAVVIRTAAGIAAELRDRHPGEDRPLVVVGQDARHKSADFARDTAAVMTGAGLRAALLPGPLPTPVLAFAIRHLGAVAGIAVTASHNPPRDNGYKVYLGDGSQIVPPADADIAARISSVGPLGDIARPGSGWDTLGEEIVDAYLDSATAVLTDGSPRTARVAYTPLHGVGQRVLTAAFARAGFPAPIEVPEQSRPDPDFPTVAFPNPEEPGAMDLVYAAARGADPAPDLVIANDPDADRCAVAVPHPAGEADGQTEGQTDGHSDEQTEGQIDGRVAGDAGWRMLHGDEVGALLAAHLIRKGARGTFATTIVSSTLVGKMAAAAGLPYTQTLTGFKWLGRVPGLRYAYEEALGYCVDPGAVRDKDGITAALLIAELAGELKADGRTLTDLLDELAVAHGLHLTDQLSVRVSELSRITDAMARLRAQPPTELAGLPVLRTDDLSAGGDGLPPTDGLRYTLEGARVVVRPSGTEPKLKCYLEAVVTVGDAAGLPSARKRAAETITALQRDVSAALGL
ncbi:MULTISPECIES: phospho-sugar mutase [unclassified Streptomyces]|uniref:phospho-sugar mutase n=1 Tax=unclassified Streptomyces TaxID=2593676 RepID=UPI000CD5A29E|nr:MULTISPECIES: phospho-sugar mutase [unclassified Streptomyces]